MTTNPYIVGPGSWYYSLQQSLEIAKDPSRSLDSIPQSDHAFTRNRDMVIVTSPATDDEKKAGFEQAYDRAKDIRDGVGAEVAIDYIETNMKEQLELGEEWEAEQK